MTLMFTQLWSLQYYFSNALNRAIHVEFELTNDDEHEFGCREDSKPDDRCFITASASGGKKKGRFLLGGALWAQKS